MSRAGKRIAVAMSGGVDSSVAAALLKEKNYDVIGVTLKLLDYSKVSCGLNEKQCCSPESLKAAREAAFKLKIPFYVIGAASSFQRSVINDFIEKYSGGLTPNPCVRCNKFIKFGLLLDRVKKLGFDLLATGHYARVVKRNGYYYLKEPKDKEKDQTYFLSALSQEQLKSAVFPLGGLTKTEVRRIASRFSLSSAGRKESEDICFVEGGDYREFLRKNIKKSIPGGKIISTDGRELGKHGGVPFYTIGQRRGLRISGHSPYYVVRTDVKSNIVTVGDDKDLFSKEFFVENLSFAQFTGDKQKVKIKIRYRTSGADGVLFRNGRAVFTEPQRAVTPGQQAVFYRRGLVFASGMIAAPR